MVIFVIILMCLYVPLAAREKPLNPNKPPVVSKEQIIDGVKQRLPNKLRLETPQVDIDNAIDNATAYVLWQKNKHTANTIEVPVSTSVTLTDDVIMVLSVEHCNPQWGCKMIGQMIDDDSDELTWSWEKPVVTIHNIDNPLVAAKSILRIRYVSITKAPQYLDAIAERANKILTNTQGVR